MFIMIGFAVLILLLIIGVILAYNRLQQLSVKVKTSFPELFTPYPFPIATLLPSI